MRWGAVRRSRDLELKLNCQQRW